MARTDTQKGFTLIELLLYIAIASIMLLLISAFLAELLQSRVKNQAIAEVEQQGVQVMHLITQTVRNTEGITSPAQGGSDSSLTLDVLEVAQDPTVFYVEDGGIFISEGGGDAEALTNSRVVVSGLTFQNLSRTDTPGTVRVQFILSHVNPEDRNEYRYEKTFVGSATVRHP